MESSWNGCLKNTSTVSKIAIKLRITYKIDDEGMEDLIQAIGLSKGNWNKCPNGHLYVIGECGGAMEVSKCPDCNAVIGGHDHQLAGGNAHANELGGNAAWDPQGFDARVARGEVNLQDLLND